MTLFITGLSYPIHTYAKNKPIHQSDEVEQASSLHGKSVLFVGDSITRAAQDTDTPDYGWAGRIGSANEMDWHNAGEAGSTIANVLTGHPAENRIVYQLQQDRSYDYVILHGGINDTLGMNTIGELSDSFRLEDFDTTTFAGAMEELLYTVKTKFPYATVGYIVNYATPHSGWGGYSDRNKEYFDVAIEACKKWNVPYLDLFNGGIKENETFKAYGSDVLHVNSGDNFNNEDASEIHLSSKGYDVISPYIQTWMEEITHKKLSSTHLYIQETLLQMINRISKSDLDGVVTMVSEKYQAALKRAQVVYRNPSSTLDNYMEAWMHLVNRMQSLSFRHESIFQDINRTQILADLDVYESEGLWGPMYDEGMSNLEQRDEAKLLEICIKAMESNVKDGVLFIRGDAWDHYVSAMEHAKTVLEHNGAYLDALSQVMRTYEALRVETYYAPFVLLHDFTNMIKSNSFVHVRQSDIAYIMSIRSKVSLALEEAETLTFERFEPLQEDINHVWNIFKERYPDVIEADNFTRFW